MVRWWAAAGLAGLTTSLYISSDKRWFYRHIAMPAFQVVDPENAHVMAINLARLGLMPKYKAPEDKILAS